MTEELELGIRKIALDEAIRVSYKSPSEVANGDKKSSAEEIVEIAKKFENYLKSGKWQEIK